MGWIVEKNERTGEVVVMVEGRLNLKGATNLKMKMLEKIDIGERIFRVDMSKADSLDSTGIGAFVTIKKKLREYQGKIFITGLQGYCLEVFKMNNLEKEFNE